MAITEYIYPLSAFHETLDSGRLLDQINLSPIITPVSYINTDTSNCYIWFEDALSPEDMTLLDNIVDQYTAAPTVVTKIINAVQEKPFRTTSNKLQAVLKVAPVDPFLTGQYRLDWSCQLKASSWRTGPIVSIDVGPEQVVFIDGANAAKWVVQSGFVFLNLEEGVHTFVVSLASEQNGRAVQMKEATLHMEKIND